MRIFKTHETFSVLQNYVHQPKIIVEIGAFQGHETIKMAEIWPNAHIHAFEPVPELYEKLVQKTAAYNNITTYNYAVSSTSGSAQFHYAEKPNKPGIATQAGSLRAPKKRLEWSPVQFTKIIDVQTITLQEWATQKNIEGIDLLWIDTQGHELSILQTADTILKTTNTIITEVGFIEAYEQQPTHDTVIKWLQQHNFDVVARDFENTTDWFFGNIVCIQSQDK